MQTFVFSATLSKDLQQNLKKRYKGGKKGAKRATALGMSFHTLGFTVMTIFGGVLLQAAGKGITDHQRT